MPEDVGGNFDGGGSVRWEVITADDDGAKAETWTEGQKRRNSGVDRRPGRRFKIVLRVPTDGSKDQFLAQFNVKPEYGYINLYLNRERVKRQVRVQWPDEISEGTTAKKSAK